MENSQPKGQPKTQDNRYSNLNPKPRPEDPNADPIRMPRRTLADTDKIQDDPGKSDPGMVPPERDPPSYPGFPGRPEEFPLDNPPNEIPERKDV